MTTPNFLVIGVPRAGTTWLYEQLLAHPDVYVPPQRKEVHFFDRYFERGSSWYAQFFPDDGATYRQIGEVTPHYLGKEACLERIVDFGGINKLIAILRNPIDRLFSHYLLRVRVDNFQGSFEEFLKARPDAVQLGFYCQQLEHYSQHFAHEQLLIIFYDDLLASEASTLQRVADFLEIDFERFPKKQEGNRKVNSGYVPRFRWLYSLMFRIGRFMRANDLYWVINLAKRLHLNKLGGVRKQNSPQMLASTRAELHALYRADIMGLQNLLSVDLSHWK